MPTRSINFGSPIQTLDATQSKDGQLQSLINGYIDVDGSFRMRPGLTLWKDLSQTGKPIIGLYHSPTMTPSHVIVLYNGSSNSVLAKITSGGTATTITGTTLANNTLATFCTDGTSVLVANGGNINQANVGAATANLVSAGNAPGTVTHVAWLQGYLLANGTISGGVAGDTNYSTDISGNYEAADSWAFYNNEAYPDSSTALYVKWDEIMAMGPESVEYSYNDGTTPWATIQGGQLHWGVLAPYSVQFIDETFMYLTHRDGGVQFVRILQRSPHSVSIKMDSVLAGVTDFVNAKSWTISLKGTPLYVVTFPSDAVTYVYNVRRNEWYQWGAYSAGTWSKFAMNAYTYVPAFNKHLVGDATDGKIWELTGITDNSSAIGFQITSGNIDWGTSFFKRCEKIRYRFKRGATSSTEPTVTIEFNDNNEGWVTIDTVSLAVAADLYMYVDLHALGTYSSRRHRLTYTGTVTDLIFVGAEETFTVMTT